MTTDAVVARLEEVTAALPDGGQRRTGQIEMATSTIGLSYDVQAGNAGRATNGRGAYELSYAWRRPFSRAQSKVVCPRF